MTSSNEWSDRYEAVKAGGTSILKKPCVRNSLMAGIATGALMGVHKFRTGRTIQKSCMASCFTFVLGSCVHMMACSYQLRRKFDDLDRAMELNGGIRASDAPELR